MKNNFNVTWEKNKSSYISEFLMFFIFSAVFAGCASESLWAIALSFFLSLILSVMTFICDLILK